jgi:phosphoglycolate phosphatase
MTSPPPAGRVVVFDLDGTLVDSRTDIVRAVRHVLGVRGGPVRTDDEIASFVGDGARSLLSRVLDVPADAPELHEALATYVAFYAEHPADHTTLMPGATAVLDELSHLPLAICTNKPRVATELVLSALGLSARFAVVVAGGDLERLKPDPAPLRRVAAQLDAPTTSLVMVGDGPQDVECGRAAGAFTIGVLGGFAPAAVLRASRPDVVVSTLRDVPRALPG